MVFDKLFLRRNLLVALAVVNIIGFVVCCFLFFSAYASEFFSKNMLVQYPFVFFVMHAFFIICLLSLIGFFLVWRDLWVVTACITPFLFLSITIVFNLIVIGQVGVEVIMLPFLGYVFWGGLFVFLEEQSIPFL